MLNRVVLLLFYGSLLMIGLVMFDAVAPNPYFGVRTAATQADPATWYAVNQVTGIFLMVLGWLGFFCVSLLRPVKTAAMLILMTGSVAALVVPAISPSAMVNLHHTLLNHGLAFSQAPHQDLIVPLLSLLVLGGAGNVLYLEQVPRNRYFGFRIRAAMHDDQAWRRANRAGGSVLQLSSAVGLLFASGLAVAGNWRGGLICTLITLFICPLAAYVAATHSLSTHGKE